MMFRALLLASALLLAALPVAAQTADSETTVTTVQTFTDQDGVKWQVTYVETKTITYVKVSTTNPVPGPVVIPVPTEPSITYKNAAGTVVQTAKAGDAITIVGSGFGAPAPAGNRIAVNGITATVQTWADKSVTFTVPFGAAGPLTLKLYSLAAASANWQLVTTATGLTAQP